jgi:hypothetical protein
MFCLLTNGSFAPGAVILLSPLFTQPRHWEIQIISCQKERANIKWLLKPLLRIAI